MKDYCYYIPAEDHYSLQIQETKEEFFEEKMVYKNQPDIYVPVVKEVYHDDQEVPGFGIMLNVKDKEINKDALNQFVKEKGIGNKTQFEDLLNSLMKFELEEDMPKGLMQYDLYELKKIYNLHRVQYVQTNFKKEMWKIYEILKLDLVKIFQDKSFTYSDEVLEECFDLPLREFERVLKRIRPDLKGKQLKKQLSILKNEVLRKKKEKEKNPDSAVEYVAVPQPHVIVKELV
jgi:hypothetical protein